MKVLHVISDENIGGAGVLLTSLLRRFDRERVESVVALPQNSLLIPRVEALAVKTIGLRHPCDRIDVRSIREIRGIIKREAVDIVHANAALSARMAGRLAGVCVIHTRHCCFEPRGIWKNGAIRKIGGGWNRLLSDCVVATADAAAENLYQFGIPQNRVEVIINGSEPIREVAESELDGYRTRFSIGEDDFCIGICARLEPYKGHEIFFHAAKRVMESCPHVRFRFLVVGDGSQRAELEALCKEMNLSPFVCFTGFVEDMAPVYRLLRVNVNCSCGTETSCLALSEGMSAGVPFLASDFGGNDAMCGGSEAGRIYPTGSAEALAAHLVRIASDRALEERMKKAAKERYEQKYTAVAMSEALTAVYERMMQSKMQH